MIEATLKKDVSTEPVSLQEIRDHYIEGCTLCGLLSEAVRSFSHEHEIQSKAQDHIVIRKSDAGLVELNVRPAMDILRNFNVEIFTLPGEGESISLHRSMRLANHDLQ